MKTQYYTASSLDGFIATEDDSLEWLFPLADLNDSSYPEFIAGVGALAMGSATYEWIVRNADKVAAETGSPWARASGCSRVGSCIRACGSYRFARWGAAWLNCDIRWPDRAALAFRPGVDRPAPAGGPRRNRRPLTPAA